ncbi:MAG: GNAT family N-acetyltransferase [Desulfobacterales bacterium]|jgi:acyl-CoA hydrolase/GNAT superfamily N-acetyltransferase
MNSAISPNLALESPVDPALFPHRDKLISAAAAAALIRPGQHVFVGTGCAAPRTLVAALEQLPDPPTDVELVHFLTTQIMPHHEGRAITRYRHRTFFVGSDMCAAVHQGLAEYVPISIAEVPILIKQGRIPLDVALIQVSLPDQFGYVSLGVSVDIIPPVLDHARLIIAEVNPHMPRSMGYSMVHLSQIHHLVPVDTPITEYIHPLVKVGAVERIARYIASLIEDGATLHVGLGRIPHSVLKYLNDRRDLGIHSTVITDSIIPLLEKGILTGRRKSDHPGKIVTSFALGTRRLYDLINGNPLFSFQTIDVICHPRTIANQYRMSTITQAFTIDLTGQVCSDQLNGKYDGGLGSQGEFLRGAARSVGGKSIICLTSTSDDGEISCIRPLLHTHEGVTISRADVHYVVTEYGIAYLFGKSMRERAIALIEVAHPRFRSWLLEEAKKLGYVPDDQQSKNRRAYAVEDEKNIALDNGRSVLLRPAKASDAPGIRALFHQLSDNDVYTRFFQRVKTLSNHEVQRLCNLNYETEVAFVATTGPREHEEIVGHACYFVNPSSQLAENAFMVTPAWQGIGLGTVMLKRMIEHAMVRSLRGFVFEILKENERMLNVVRGRCKNITTERSNEAVYITLMFERATDQSKIWIDSDTARIDNSVYVQFKAMSGSETAWSPYLDEENFENRIC